MKENEQRMNGRYSAKGLVCIHGSQTACKGMKCRWEAYTGSTDYNVLCVREKGADEKYCNP